MVGGHKGSENKFIRFESTLWLWPEITVTGVESRKSLFLSSDTFLPSIADKKDNQDNSSNEVYEAATAAAPANINNNNNEVNNTKEDNNKDKDSAEAAAGSFVGGCSISGGNCGGIGGGGFGRGWWVVMMVGVIVCHTTTAMRGVHNNQPEEGRAAKTPAIVGKATGNNQLARQNNERAAQY
jgi:hypothetical protein